MKLPHLLNACFLILLPILLWAEIPRPMEYKLNGFSVEYSDITSPYTVAALFELPGVKVRIKIREGQEENTKRDFIFFTSGGISYPISENEWMWELPDTTGHYSLRLIENQSRQEFKLNAFVLFPYTEKKGRIINNFEVGNYPDSQQDIYQKPKGFIEVKPEMTDLHLSPHFQVRDFLCKQKCNYPMYLVLKEKLMLKLEKIYEKLEEKGLDIENIAIMSGYRTPYYNEAIDNVKFSRHQFGDAADIYVDNNHDFYMDDLNKDGKSNAQDVEVLYQAILAMTDKEWYKPFIGGLGFYRPASHRTGFVHVDVRGNPARWGH